MSRDISESVKDTGGRGGEGRHTRHVTGYLRECKGYRGEGRDVTGRGGTLVMSRDI